MAEIIPIKRHREYVRHTKQSAAGVLRTVRAQDPKEVLVIYVDQEDDYRVLSSPCDPCNALWMMEMAKKLLVNAQ